MKGHLLAYPIPNALNSLQEALNTAEKLRKNDTLNSIVSLLTRVLTLLNIAQY